MEDALADVRKYNLACVEMSPEFLLELLRLTDGICIDGGLMELVGDKIPEEAEALRCTLSANGNVNLIIEHESFSEVVEGNVVPTLRLAYSVRIPS